MFRSISVTPGISLLRRSISIPKFAQLKSPLACAALPFSIASVNLNNQPLSHAAVFLSTQPKSPDVLCVQEVTKSKVSENIVLDGSNQKSLALFNKSNRLSAQAAFIADRSGIIILRPGITVRSHTIGSWIVTAQLRLDGTLRADDPTSNHITIVSAYAPVVSADREGFFKSDLKNEINRIATSGAPGVILGDLTDFELPSLDRWPPYRKEDKDEREASRAEKRRLWAKVLTPILDAANFWDAFLYPESREYTRHELDAEKNPISSTRLDHILVSADLLDSLHEVTYHITGFKTDHSLIQVQFNNETDVDPAEDQTDQDSIEPLVGTGVWKLYHGAFTERHFYLRSQVFAEQLFESSRYTGPFTIDAWKEAKDRLHHHAMSVSITTGYKRKQPGRKMTEIQEKLDALDLDNKPARSQFAELLGELRRYHTLLVLDDNRRTGLHLSRVVSQPDKKHVSPPQYIRRLRATPDDVPVSGVREKEQVAMGFYHSLYCTPLQRPSISNPLITS